MIDWLSLAIVALAAGLLILLTRLRRKTPATLRPLPALTRFYRAFGSSIEDGTRLLVALGSNSLLTRNAGSALAGLGLLKEVALKGTGSDRPPIAVSGEAALALLAQDTLHAGYRQAGTDMYSQPVTGRLAGLSPFSAAAATMTMFQDDSVSVAAMLGNFGVDAALVCDAASRADALVVGATGDPVGQSVLYATSSEALIGEELFAAPAYFGGGPVHTGSLVVQDVLRWIIIGGLLLGAAMKVLGIL